MTKVIFLIDKPFNPDFLPAVFAFFVDDTHGCNMHSSFSSGDSHSLCHIDYAKECKKARPDEYAPLFKQMTEQIGYKLKVVKEFA